ncbi:hypothetical protein HALLA_14760 [Halostagnicola larsenii XH-48]|uniref:Uncharacterized protein n=1 Tax=Halostagnicola larsenii XH-48 TaxID=797299 RepID=W0JVH2_9EURY|nr:hypothetical protein [Halostagnicola larsenii]AHG01058.1 hypothetical protein HALLA_14760 [Halostagnicola larsenii XH-48]
MSDRNAIEELEARLGFVPRRRLVLGVVLLIPPFTILGVALLGYELLRAGKPLREAENERLIGPDPDAKDISTEYEP